MLDVRTLIFCVALGNLTFALLVWVYTQSREDKNHPLKLWQVAKIITGIGFFLGWLRPLLPEEFQMYAQVGNGMRTAGICIELVAYASFLGIPHWLKRLGVPLLILVLTFGLVIASGASPNTTIVLGTGFGGFVYLAMAALMLSYTNKDPVLTRVIGVLDLILALSLLTKSAVSLIGVESLPYASDELNEALSTLGFMVLMSNGFGFLLLIKQEDDRNLHRLVTELSIADTHQRNFIAMLSHEVRSPTAVISASAQLLTLHLQDQPQHTPLLLRIHRGVARLSHFFDNCLTQDRVFSQNFRLTHSKVDMSVLVKSIFENSEVLTEEHFFLTIELPDTPAYVSGDAALLRIAVNNLISNAVKFAPQGSSISLRLTLDADHCLLSVEDNGPGVAEADRELIFQKYRRGAMAERTPGAGLGLAIVRSVVDLHHGRVSVTDAPKGGACFVIRLPDVGAF